MKINLAIILIVFSVNSFANGADKATDENVVPISPPAKSPGNRQQKMQDNMSRMKQKQQKEQGESPLRIDNGNKTHKKIREKYDTGY